MQNRILYMDFLVVGFARFEIHFSSFQFQFRNCFFVMRLRKEIRKRLQIGLDHAHRTWNEHIEREREILLYLHMYKYSWTDVDG